MACLAVGLIPTMEGSNVITICIITYTNTITHVNKINTSPLVQVALRINFITTSIVMHVLIHNSISSIVC
jgi:hypothetical protein